MNLRCWFGFHDWRNVVKPRLVVGCPRCGTGDRTDLEGGMPSTPVHVRLTEDGVLRELVNVSPPGLLAVWLEKPA